MYTYNHINMMVFIRPNVKRRTSLDYLTLYSYKRDFTLEEN